MNILALDTSDQVMSVALSCETGVWYTETDASSRHSELLMESVDWLFKTAGLKGSDLDKVACMKGPGSFTGLRIGFSAAKGIALALGIPLFSQSTLDCIAYPFSQWPGLVLPVMDAKKGCFFSALYRRGKRLTDYMDASPQALAGELTKLRLLNETVFLTGCGAELFSSHIPSAFSGNQAESGFFIVDAASKRGRARELLEITKKSIMEDREDNESGPVYLRKSDAELKLS